MSTDNNITNAVVKKPSLEQINPWRESVLFILIGTSTVTIGVVFSIISILLPLLAVPWFITSIPTGLTEADTFIEYIQAFAGDVSAAIIAAVILGLIAHYLYKLNKLIFYTIKIFDNKFRWMDPVNIITRIDDWKSKLKVAMIIAITLGLTFTAITMFGFGLSWEEWGNRGN